METKFKVGDRVEHRNGRKGVVVKVDYSNIERQVTVNFGYKRAIVSANNLFLSAQPAPPTHPDRADYAFGFAKTMMGNVPNFDHDTMGAIPAAAVKLADALIAELQRTKQ